jgi:hypothetical protein
MLARTASIASTAPRKAGSAAFVSSFQTLFDIQGARDEVSPNSSLRNLLVAGLRLSRGPASKQ